MADLIQAEYGQLTAVAKRFADGSAAVRQMRESLKGKVERLRSGWVGRGSDAFFNEMTDKVLPAVARLSDALAEADRVTRQMAQLIADAEADAAAPFRSPIADWDILTNEQKTAALQRIADEIAEQYGLDHLPVSVEQITDPPGQDARGAWDGSTIHVDVDNLASSDVIDTVAHEARHAVQQHLGDLATPSWWDQLMRRVGIQPTPEWPQYGITEETARQWDENRHNYRQPPAAYNPNDPDSRRLFQEYLNQPIESDARDYSQRYRDWLQGNGPLPGRN